MTNRRMTTTRPPGRVSAAGFTLVEMLVTIGVVGVFGAALVGLFMGQNAFYLENDESAFAGETRRGAAEILSMELREASTGDLYTAKSDSIHTRYDYRRAVVCDSDAALGTVTLFVYHRTGVNLSSGTTGTAVSGPFQGTFDREDGWTPTLSQTGSVPKNTCVSNGAPDVADGTRYRLEDWLTHPTGVIPRPGSIVRVYGDLAYAFRPSQFADGLALWRNGQELAAPLRDDAAFSYVMEGGGMQSNVGTGNFDQIRRVRVEAVATGEGSNRFDVYRDLEFEMPFRN